MSDSESTSRFHQEIIKVSIGILKFLKDGKQHEFVDVPGERNKVFAVSMEDLISLNLVNLELVDEKGILHITDQGMDYLNQRKKRKEQKKVIKEQKRVIKEQKRVIKEHFTKKREDSRRKNDLLRRLEILQDSGEERLRELEETEETEETQKLKAKLHRKMEEVKEFRAEILEEEF